MKMCKKPLNWEHDDNQFGLDKAAAKRLLSKQLRVMRYTTGMVEVYMRQCVNKYVRQHHVDLDHVEMTDSVVFKTDYSVYNSFLVKVWLPRESDAVPKLPVIELCDRDGYVLHMLLDGMTETALRAAQLSRLAGVEPVQPDMCWDFSINENFPPRSTLIDLVKDV